MVKEGQYVGSNFRREDLNKVYSQGHQHGHQHEQPPTTVRTFPDNGSIYGEETILVVFLVDTNATLSISKCKLSFLFLHAVDHAQLLISRGEPKGLGSLLK